jgi:CDP-glucose 4,6-dehydratase
MWDQPTLTGAYNFGPDSGEVKIVRDLVELACAAYGEGTVDYGAGSDGPHETAWLALDAAKAESMLGVSPAWTLVEAVKRTMAWYRMQRDGADVRELCHDDISDFENRANGFAGVETRAQVKFAG